MKVNPLHRILAIPGMVITLAFTFGLPPAKAYSMTVIPPRVEIFVRPGQRVVGSILVKGEFDRPTKVRVRPADWSMGLKGDVTFLPLRSHPRSLTGWLSFQPAEFLLSRERRQIIRYEMRAPQDIQGSYWGALLFESEPVGGSGGNSVSIGTAVRLVTMFYASTERGCVLDGRLEQVSAQYARGQLTMAARFTNRGNMIATLTGHFELINKKTGKTQVKATLSRLTVLPGATRALSADWQGNLPPGEYEPVLYIDYGRKTSLRGQAVKI